MASRTSRTRLRISLFTVWLLLITLETVEMETLAIRATSFIVIFIVHTDFQASIYLEKGSQSQLNLLYQFIEFNKDSRAKKALDLGL